MYDDGSDPQDSATWSPIDSREWYQAREAAGSLRDVLMAAGMERDFPYLRADLNAFGQGFIELGRISPETAERVAHLLRLALTCPQDANTGGSPDRRPN
ncbi:hypothetical protein [Streptomyces zingiberis]|uniref:Uncharacterized protein n=1 Tax=Streptomyces zingiberis TaxID=2053010 RepID=A0ABX1BSZ7_9ACTN|nr:hypothetical protein [Streptomyces zingiberis]NJQ00831.1 hypothetical protein [Streptomyces zingiberis]